MAKPSVLCSSGRKMISVLDGRILLNNGKQVVLALLKVLKEIADQEVSLDDLDWVVGDLNMTFDQGLQVDLVEFP